MVSILYICSAPTVLVSQLYHVLSVNDPYSKVV